MTYGEFGAVLNTNDNSHIAELLDHNVILEMDGLSSASDKVLFSEALTLYLYRYRLACGPQNKLTNMIIIEEAHNLLLKKSNEARESVLETSIRMIRQYGMGYLFVDQSASLLSNVAFANSYATIALSQKLRSDVQTITGAMNLADDQKQALNTLPIGTAVVRLADEYPEAFLVKIRKFPITEGSIADSVIKTNWASFNSNSAPNSVIQPSIEAVSAIPVADNKEKTNWNNHKNGTNKDTRPPSPKDNNTEVKQFSAIVSNILVNKLNREELRVLTDVAARPLSSTVLRYNRLNLSRRCGNAIRQSLAAAALIEAVTIATRSGQVVLYQLTENGRAVCESEHIDPGPQYRPSLEHRYWVRQASRHYEKKGFEIKCEYPVKGNGAVDILAAKGGRKIVIEIETGKSNIKANIEKIEGAGFDKIILIATNPAAIGKCQRAIDSTERNDTAVELLSWLDIS
jgi:hypothetical protein